MTDIDQYRKEKRHLDEAIKRLERQIENYENAVSMLKRADYDHSKLIAMYQQNADDLRKVIAELLSTTDDLICMTKQREKDIANAIRQGQDFYAQQSQMI